MWRQLLLHRIITLEIIIQEDIIKEGVDLLIEEEEVVGEHLTIEFIVNYVENQDILWIDAIIDLIGIFSV